MANISEITIEVPLQGFKKAVGNLKKFAAAKVYANLQKKADENGITVPAEVSDKLKKIVGSETPLFQTADTTQKFITNEPPTTPAMSETQTTENKKGFPWWIVAVAGVGLILLNSNNKKRKK